MRKSSCVSKFIATLFLILLSNGEGLGSIHRAPTGFSNQESSRKDESNKDELIRPIYATGSSLPDCSHACGPCFPCKRVMVSFECSIAESCPIVYRCMCRGRYYHVPSN